MIVRGAIHWVDLGSPEGSTPANRRPVLVVQADSFNNSAISTVLTVVITSNTRLATIPGNVFLPANATGLPRDSVANVSQIVACNRNDLLDYAGQVPADLMPEVDRGIALVLGL